MIYHDFYFFGFFSQGKSSSFDFNWFQIFGVRKNVGFSLADLIFSEPIFRALNSSQNFDAMNVRRYGKSPHSKVLGE